MDRNTLLQHVAYLIPMVLSLTVHEWAHAYSAFRLGDDTAMRLGRMTLDPRSHIDPVGTLLLPLIGVPFGWAKPVPVVYSRFSRNVSMRTGMWVTAAAGPAANLVLGFLCVILLGAMFRFGLQQEAIEWLLSRGFELNMMLAVFNMLPIPPLDGGRVADGLMPLRFRPWWDRYAQYGPLVLLILLVLPRGLGTSFLAWPLSGARSVAGALLRLIAGV